MDVLNDIGPDGKGRFYLPGTGSDAAEMEVSVESGILTVYHTEVKKEFENQGLAKELLAGMVAYAREHRLSVKPLCPFVTARFRRNPEAYADLWKPQS